MQVFLNSLLTKIWFLGWIQLSKDKLKIVEPRIVEIAEGKSRSYLGDDLRGPATSRSLKNKNERRS